MQRRIYKSVVLPSVVFPSLVAREPKVDWKGKPADWSDIRKDCPANSIALYAGVKSDYSAYDNLGFTATCVGGYNVYIDGTQYGTTYASGATCSITWSSLALDTGDDITTPSAMKAHKIWVEPATSGNNITAFQCNRVAASGTEEQGILWAHFNLTNVIKIASIFGREVRYNNMILNAITAKNNLITYGINQNGAQSGFYSAFYNCSSLEYLPVLKAENTTYPSGTYLSFRNVPAKKIVIKNNNGLEGLGCLNYAKIEEIKAQNGFTMETGTGNSNMVISSTLKKFPKINDNKGATFILKNCTALEPTNIDDRFNNIRTLFQFCGTTASNRTALTSLRVSSEAPFDNATSPQINVSYTGLDRNALVQLFNDLPNVSAGQIINITGTTGSEDLTASDIAIAENKGWTITK